MHGVGAEVSAPPAVAEELFGAALPAAVRYAELLATAGVERGLIGPRETERLWDRHLCNCAVLAEIVPSGASVVDVGSGAGLPGIPLALAMPELRVVLLEPMERRCVFLGEAVAELGLADRVAVTRGRAPDAAAGRSGLRAEVVVARAVAPLAKLSGMLLPLLVPGGVMLAMRGSRVEDELAEARASLRAQGWRDVRVVRCGVGRLDEPTRVVTAARGSGGAERRGGGEQHDGRQRGRTAKPARGARGRACST